VQDFRLFELPAPLRSSQLKGRACEHLNVVKCVLGFPANLTIGPHGLKQRNDCR
jgi:hypothetical protein